MNRKVVLSILILLGIILSGIVVYQPFSAAEHTAWHPGKETPSPPSLVQKPANPYVAALLKDYEASVNELMKYSGIPGAAIAIVKDSSIIYLKGFGVKMIGKKDSVDYNTVFRIGSVSKCFASVLTGILVQDGILSWNDPIIHHLPDFALKSEEHTELLTVKHVLSHTTGLPYHTFTTAVEDGTDLHTMIKKLRDIKLFGKPGEIYSYQNVAYSVIDEVMHAATDKTYQDLIQEKIFHPLHMKNASVTYDGIIQNGNIAQPHLMRRRTWYPIPVSDKYYNVAPAGGVNASALDMAHWMTALLGNRQDVIKSKTLQEIFKPLVSANSKNRSYRMIGALKGTYYGLGWRILHFPHDTLVYHGGYVNGFRSEVAIHTQDKIAICILSNAPGDVADKGIPLFFQLYNERKDVIKNWEANPQPILAWLPE